MSDEHKPELSAQAGRQRRDLDTTRCPAAQEMGRARPRRTLGWDAVAPCSSGVASSMLMGTGPGEGS